MLKKNVNKSFTVLLLFFVFFVFCNTSTASASTEVEQFVSRFYQHCLNRESDSQGLDFWVSTLNSRQNAGADVAREFVLSQEFTERNVSNQDFVTIMYRAFFDREPDPQGQQWWLDALGNNHPRTSVFEGFINSGEFHDLCKKFNIDPQPENPAPAPNPPSPPAPSPAGTLIVSPTRATVQQAQRWAAARGAHQRFIDIAPLYWEFGSLTGINPEILYSQSAKETAFGRYSGAVTPEMNNWAGIKIRNPIGDRREDHETFATPRDGVRAHFNHMSAYVGKTPIGDPHDRYYVVMSISWAGTVQTVETLGAKWAPATGYGESIVKDYLVHLYTF